MTRVGPRPQLILASQSPRRRELLERLRIPFTVQAANLDESARPSEAPSAYVERLAAEKASAVARAGSGALVLAADTTVVIGGEILGKPADTADAVAMLGRLSGKVHEVLTGIAVASPGGTSSSKVVRTEVRFRRAEREELEWYAATGEPLDKAGAYALQGIGAFLVEEISGSPTNVIGLPLPETLALLADSGFDWRSR